MNTIREGSLEEHIKLNDDDEDDDSRLTHLSEIIFNSNKEISNSRKSSFSSSLPNCHDSKNNEIYNIDVKISNNQEDTIEEEETNLSTRSLFHHSLKLISSCNKSDNQLELINKKTNSKSSLSPNSNKFTFNNRESNSESVSPIQTRKSTLKQRIRRFNSSIENRIFNIKSSDNSNSNSNNNSSSTNNKSNINNSNKSLSFKGINKIQAKNQEITDEAKQAKKYQKNESIFEKLSNNTHKNIKNEIQVSSILNNESRDKTSTTTNTTKTTKATNKANNSDSIRNYLNYTKKKVDFENDSDLKLINEISNKINKNMNNNNNQIIKNIDQKSKLNQNEPDTANNLKSEIKSINENSSVLIDSNQENETDLFKKAIYEIQVPRDAIKTSLKSKTKYIVLKDNKEIDNLLNKLNIPNKNESDTTDPNTTVKTVTTSTKNDSSDVTTTTTTITTTTKTVIKLNDLNRKKNMSKRRNTVSTIAVNNNKSNQNISNGFQTPNLLFDIKKSNKMMASEITEISETNIFDIIEKEDAEYLAKKLLVNPNCVNDINELKFTPLDMALMLNNKKLIDILLKNGAIENSALCDWNDRYDIVCSKLNELDQNLRLLLENFNVSQVSLEQIEEYDVKLKNFDLKMKLVRKMKSNYELTDYPGLVRNISLEVFNSNSLMVSFDEPVNKNFIIKYMIEWSSNSTFEPLDGQIVLTFVDDTAKQYLITNLATYKVYYVRVSCANIRGYGSYSSSDPPFAIPSYWREGDPVREKFLFQIKKLNDLESEINFSKLNLEFVNANNLNQLQKFSKSKKQSTSALKKNLKTFFTLALATSNSANYSSYHNANSGNLKFAKQIKKSSVYLVSVIYDGDKVLTTLDDNLPMIEIDENYSYQNINNDFQFLVKLSFNWNEIENFKNLIEQTINTSSLRFRYLALCVIKQMQNLLEFSDLGRVYYQYLKNTSNGSVFFILIKNITNTFININQNLKFYQIEKLINKTSLINNKVNFADNTFNSNKDNTLYKDMEDSIFLFKHLKTIIDYNSNCEKKLSRGFYVAFLKLQSTIELLKIMVPFKIPNNLPCCKVRDNPNVSREEWNLLKSVKLNSDKLSINELNSINFLKLISKASNQLLAQLDIKPEERENLRIITKELIEVNEDISILLICPALEQTCIMQVSDDPVPNLPTGLTTDLYLPVLLFEAIHLSTYNLEFIKNYVRISIKLEIENLAANQFNREAFSNDEITVSKQILNLVSKYQKLLEDIWKESRWIIECINHARDKNSNQQQNSSNIIQFSDLKLFLKNFSEKNNKNTKCCKCDLDSNNNDNILDYNNPDLAYNKKNIYNHITKLPQSGNCQCDEKNKNNNNNNNNNNNLNNILTKIGYNNVNNLNYFNHIDSVLIDDEDLGEQENLIHNSQFEAKNTSKQGSIEDLTINNKKQNQNKNCNICLDCLKNCNNCQKEKENFNLSLNSLEKFANTDPNSVLKQSSQSMLSNKSNKSDDEQSILANKNNNTKTIHRLISKVYISAPTTPTNLKYELDENMIEPKPSNNSRKSTDTNSCYPSNSYASSACSVFSNSNNNNPKIKEHLVDSPLSTSSSSGYYSITSKHDSDLSSPSNIKNESWQSLNLNNSSSNSFSRKLIVYVDFFTGLKIDVNFECTINCQTTSNDLIYHIIKKLNSFISCFNQINKNFIESDDFPSNLLNNSNNNNNNSNEDCKTKTSNTDNAFVSVISSLDLNNCGKTKIASSKKDTINSISVLDENTSLYYLVVICIKNNYTNEKVLSNNFLLSTLKDPWINGNFYLRNNPKNPLEKKN